MSKRITALLLGICLLAMAAVLPVAADPGASGGVGARTEAEGSCGAALSWTLYVNGLLEISGNGGMHDNETSWSDYKAKVTKIVVNKGVTTLGANAFAGFVNVTEATLGVGVTQIGDGAFADCQGLANLYYSGNQTGWKAIEIGQNNDPLGAATVTFPNIRGWSEEGDTWYYYENGLPVTNAWREDSKGWIWLGEDGAMVTDRWVRDSIGWCYVGADGYCLTSTWKEHENGWVYLNASGSMAKNTWIKRDGKWSYLGEDGFAVTLCWAQDSSGWLWLDGEGYAVSDQWIRDGENFYYCNADCFRVTGEQTIDGHVYPFDENGVLLEVYTLVFRNWDGGVISQERYKYGDKPHLPEAPVKEADEAYTYQFSGWLPEVVAVTENAEYTAIYEVTEIPAGTENAIVKQPESINAETGTNVQFKVKVTGEVVSYKWEYRKIYKWFNTSMAGYNTDTLTVPATGARNGYGYRCTITFADGTELVSEVAKLTVNTYITNIQNPNDQTVVLGYKGQFSADATGESLKFQWEYKRPDGERWIETAMEGATKATVMIETTTARDGYQYRCRITDVAGVVTYTEPATMRVLSFKSHPLETFAATGATVTMSVTTSVTEGFKYEWYYSKNNGATWSPTTMTGYNTDTLTITAKGKNGYMYKCILTGSKNSKIESKGAVLHVGDPVVINAQPQSVTATAADTVTFTVDATNVYAYQWKYSKSGTTWYETGAEGNQTATLTIAASGKNGYRYRCHIYGLDGTETITEVVTLTV